MEDQREKIPRRKFLKRVFNTALLAAVALPLLQFARIVVRYLYPVDKGERWFFVTIVEAFRKGQSMNYVSPEGQSVVVSRTGEAGTAADFIALSNVCPHLGCKVYWEGATDSFFCPCHNGRFDAEGIPLEGPPKQAGQELIRFPLKIEKGLLYIGLSSESLIMLTELKKTHENCSRKGVHA